MHVRLLMVGRVPLLGMLVLVLVLMELLLLLVLLVLLLLLLLLEVVLLLLLLLYVGPSAANAAHARRGAPKHGVTLLLRWLMLAIRVDAGVKGRHLGDHLLVLVVVVKRGAWNH